MSINWRPKKPNYRRLPELQQHLAELQENNTYRDNLNPEVKQEIISTNDVFIPSPNMVIDYQQNENETPHYPYQVE